MAGDEAAGARLDFRLLGPLEVAKDGQPLRLQGRRQRALLALLVVHRNEVVSTDRIIDELFGGRATDKAANAVQAVVSRLRHALEDRGESRILVTRPPGYVLKLAPEQVDLARFERLLAEGRRVLSAGDPIGAASALQVALELWRGQPLADLGSEEFVERERRRLDELRLAAIMERIEADLALGRHAEVVPELDMLVSEHPTEERLRMQLMLALYRCGRQAEALETYQRTRESFVEDLGIDPGKPLRDLHQAILRQDPRLDHTELASPRDADGGAATFVGREFELDAMRSGLEEALSGQGRLFLVSGEPGIGKSRLAEELARGARSDGFRILVGRAWEAGGAPVYWPWVQSLRSLVGEIPDERLRALLGVRAAELVGLLPEVRERVPDLEPPVEHDPEVARFRLFEAVASLLARASQSQPILLVLDDLHAADDSSLLMLRFVARELATARVVVLASYRDVDPTPSHPLTVTVTELMREPLTRQLVLTGLREQDIARFIELISSEVPTQEFAAMIHAETEGNPLFAGEIVRLLAAEGALGAADLTELAIPQTVRDVIARRLAHLSEACNRVLVLASILGRDFRVDALSVLAELQEDELVEALDEALGARVLAESPGAFGQLRFAHVLIRDTMYEGLTTVRRIGLHRRAMHALEALYQRDSGPHLAELAFHAAAGGELARAVSYAQRAGDRAVALLAYEEAARLYRTALDALELDPPVAVPTKCELLLALGEALSKGGDTAEAEEAFVAAAGVARESNLSEHLARAALGYGGRFPWLRAGTDLRLVPLLEEALEALGADESQLKVRVLARLAGALRDQPSLEPRSTLAREAVAIARRLEDPETLGYALVSLTTATWGPDVEQLMPYVDEVKTLAEETGDLERMFQWGWLQHIVWMSLGETARVEEVAASHRVVADELKQRSQQWYSMVMRSVLALFRGQFAEAERLAEEARGLGGRAQSWDCEFSYRILVFALRREQGRLHEVESLIRASIEEYAGYRSLRCLVPLIECELGRVDAARADFDQLAAQGFLDLPRDGEWLFNLSILAEVAAHLADTRRADRLYDLLLPFGHLNAQLTAEIAVGSVSRYLGILAATLGRVDEAADHFEKALEMNTRFGATPWVAHTREDFGRMLLASADPHERERGRELQALALAAYRELGMTGPLERARNDTRSSDEPGAPRPSPSPTPPRGEQLRDPAGS